MMQVAVKQRVFGVPEASRGNGAGLGGVLRVHVGGFIVSELWAVVQKGTEWGIWPSSMNTSLVTWQCHRLARGVEQGFGDRVGASWMVR